MVLEVGGRGAAGFRIVRNAWAVIIFMVLDVGWKGAAGFGINKKCIGHSLFSWFGKWAGFRITRDS